MCRGSIRCAALIMNSLGGRKCTDVEGRSCANREGGVKVGCENKVGHIRPANAASHPNPRPGQLNFIGNDKYKKSRTRGDKSPRTDSHHRLPS